MVAGLAGIDVGGVAPGVAPAVSVIAGNVAGVAIIVGAVACFWCGHPCWCCCLHRSARTSHHSWRNLIVAVVAVIVAAFAGI